MGEIVIPQDLNSLTITKKKKIELEHNKMSHIGNKGLKYLSNQKLLGKDVIEPP